MTDWRLSACRQRKWHRKPIEITCCPLRIRNTAPTVPTNECNFFIRWRSFARFRVAIDAFYWRRVSDHWRDRCPRSRQIEFARTANSLLSINQMQTHVRSLCIGDLCDAFIKWQRSIRFKYLLIVSEFCMRKPHYIHFIPNEVIKQKWNIRSSRQFSGMRRQNTPKTLHW